MQEKEDGPLQKFFEVIMDSGGEFMRTVNEMRDVTLLAPSNEAWNDAGVRSILQDKQKMARILNLHLMRSRVNVEHLQQESRRGVSFH